MSYMLYKFQVLMNLI